MGFLLKRQKIINLVIITEGMNLKFLSTGGLLKLLKIT